MPNEDHLPDLRYARNWLDEIRTDLLAAREQARLANGDWRPTVLALANFAQLADKHAATLGDIIARGQVIPRLPERARELLGNDFLYREDVHELGSLVLDALGAGIRESGPRDETREARVAALEQESEQLDATTRDHDERLSRVEEELRALESRMEDLETL